jgi:hypothetical protein
VDADMQPVPCSVRVGMAVDTVGQAGKPKTITGFQTHTTPVRYHSHLITLTTHPAHAAHAAHAAHCAAAATYVTCLTRGLTLPLSALCPSCPSVLWL